MRTWIPIVVLGLSVAVLGYRVVALQREVDTLSQLVGERRVEAARKGGKPGSSGPALSERVRTIEDEVDGINARFRVLARHVVAEQPSSGDGGGGVDKGEVLSILADETDRVLTKQLEFHRANLMATRKPGFDAFVQGARLTDSQGRLLWQYLEAEADAFVDLLRIPEIREDPTRLIKEIQAVLRATDDKVRTILDAGQMKTYLEGRAIEQTAIMPWVKLAESQPP